MELKQRGEVVVARFFEAVAVLSAEHSEAEVCRACGFDRRNLYNKRKGVWGKRTIHVAWLSMLCDKYRVSSEWLLLGKGKMFGK